MAKAITDIFYALVPLVVLLVASVLACIVGYVIFQLIDGQFPLPKIISKATQLLLVLSIFPAMAYLKVNKADLGFAVKAVFIKQLLLGFIVGFVTLMPVFIVQYGLGIHIIDVTRQWTAGLVAEKMAISLSLALLISMIEEPIFRGILFVGLKKKLPVVAAILLSSAYYAALHFINSKTEIPLPQVDLLACFSLLVDAFANVLNPEHLSAFLALLMVGVFLGTLRSEVKDSLGLCIGCHTCWVWQIKMSKDLFNTDLNSEYVYLVSRYDGVIGPLVTVWLALTILGYIVVRKAKA